MPEIQDRIDNTILSAMALYFSGKLDEGVELLGSELESHEPGSLPDLERAKLLASLGKLLVHRAFLTSSSCDEPIEKLTAAIEISVREGAEIVLALALCYRGFTFYTNTFHNKVGKYEDAMPDLERSLEIRERIGDTRGISESLVYLGILQERTDQPDLAIASYERSAKIAEENDHRLELSYAVRHLAFIKQNAGDLAGAVEFFKRSLKLRQEVGFRVGLALAHFSLGHVLLESKRYEEALAQNEAALKLVEEFELTRVATLCYYVYGEIYVGQEKPELAREHFERSREISQEIGYYIGVERAEKSLEELGS